MDATRHDVIEELEQALAVRSMGYRADALRRVTDLFLAAPTDYSAHQLDLFDHVMVRLVDELQTSVRAALAERLAAIPNAPQTLVRRLAADAAIEVAGPVLRLSPRLGEPDLTERARAGSQDHLLAISRRTTITEAVTDVLIERGDRTVALSTVKNPGARFSPAGQDTLVERSREDDELAVGVWARADIPHHRLLHLFAVASDSVRTSLEAADRQKTAFIRDIVADVSNRIQGELRAASPDYAAAREAVMAVFRSGDLTATRLEAFAVEGRFAETSVALSLMCDLPIGAVERAMVSDRPELVLLLARSIGLDWPVTKAILNVRAGKAGLGTREREQGLAAYTRLRPETANKALQFLRLRERALAAGADKGVLR